MLLPFYMLCPFMKLRISNETDSRLVIHLISENHFAEELPKGQFQSNWCFRAFTCGNVFSRYTRATTFCYNIAHTIGPPFYFTTIPFTDCCVYFCAIGVQISSGTLTFSSVLTNFRINLAIVFGYSTVLNARPQCSSLYLLKNRGAYYTTPNDKYEPMYNFKTPKHHISVCQMELSTSKYSP